MSFGAGAVFNLGLIDPKALNNIIDASRMGGELKGLDGGFGPSFCFVAVRL